MPAAVPTPRSKSSAFRTRPERGFRSRPSSSSAMTPRTDAYPRPPKRPSVAAGAAGRANLARRRAPEKAALLEDAIGFDRDWRRHLQELQALRHRRNAVSQEIGNLVKAGKDTTAHRAEAAALPERIEGLEILVDDARAAKDVGAL